MLNLNKTQPSDVSSLPFAGKTLSLILAGSVLLASSLFSQPSEAAKPRGDRGMERGGGDNGMFEAPMSDVALVMPDQSWSFVIDTRGLPSTADELSPEERTLARELQPLLDQKQYSQALTLLNARPADQDSVRMALLRGQILLTLDKFKAAESSLKRVIELKSDSAPAHRGLAMIYMKNQNFKAARQHLQKALALGGQEAQLFGQLAYVNLQMDNAAAAVSGYQQALFLDAENKQWARGLLFALTRSQAFDQAQGLVEELISSTPDSAEFWLIRSQIALRQDRYNEALSSLEYAMMLGDNKPSNMLTAAQLHSRYGSLDRTIELLTDRRLLTGKQSRGAVNTLIQTADWLASEERWKALRSLLAKVNKKDLPKQAGGRLAISEARLAMAEGKSTQAEKLLKQAVDRHPGNGDALLLLAQLLADKQRYQQAGMIYLRAESIDRVRERAMLGRAQLEIDQRNYKEALRLISSVVRENPARTDLSASIQSLQNLVQTQG